MNKKLVLAYMIENLQNLNMQLHFQADYAATPQELNRITLILLTPPASVLATPKPIHVRINKYLSEIGFCSQHMFNNDFSTYFSALLHQPTSLGMERKQMMFFKILL